jgi:hypothetical protein
MLRSQLESRVARQVAHINSSPRINAAGRGFKHLEISIPSWKKKLLKNVLIRTESVGRKLLPEQH